MKAIKYERDTVLIQKGKIKAWVDVVIYRGELSYDWNKYIFFLNREADIILRNWQDDAQNFDIATDLAVETLINEGIIFRDENDKWHTTEKYHTTKGAVSISQ